MHRSTPMLFTLLTTTLLTDCILLMVTVAA